MIDARRFGGSSSETIQRVIASRPKLAQNAYHLRHHHHHHHHHRLYSPGWALVSS
jgi:hypothetical protein